MYTVPEPVDLELLIFALYSAYHFSPLLSGIAKNNREFNNTHDKRNVRLVKTINFNVLQIEFIICIFFIVNNSTFEPGDYYIALLV